MEFLGSFKKLPLGWYRLVLVLWLIVPITTISILDELINIPSDEYFIVLGSSLISFYVLVRLIIWVRDGFKK